MESRECVLRIISTKKEEEPKRNKYINGVCIGEGRIKKEYFV